MRCGGGLADQTRDLVSTLREMLSSQLSQTSQFLLVHRDAGEDVGESAREAVGMTHGLVDACMQVTQDGQQLVQDTAAKIETIRKQVDLMEAQLAKAGIL